MVDAGVQAGTISEAEYRPMHGSRERVEAWGKARRAAR